MRNLLYYSIVVELLHRTLVTRLLKETPPFLSVDICSIWQATSEQKKLGTIHLRRRHFVVGRGQEFAKFADG